MKLHKMSKQMQSMFSWERWIPIIITMIVNVILVVNSFNQVRNSVDLLSQKLDLYTQKVDNLTIAVTKIESHVCQLDNVHGITCINGGN
jgi:hypothetical protein